MNSVQVALALVEGHQIAPQDALEIVIEGDAGKAAQKMAAKIKDPEKRKSAEARYRKEIEAMMSKGK